MVSYRFLFLTTLSAFKKGASGSFLADTSLFFLLFGDVLTSLFVLNADVIAVASGLLTTFLGWTSVALTSYYSSS